MNEGQRWRFRLRVEPLPDETYRLTLLQQLPATNGRRPQVRPIGRLQGTPLLVALDQVLELLRAEGYRRLWPRAAGTSGRHELELEEASGVRLGVLFLALRPVRRVERMERIAAGVRALTDEEAYYWFSKCVAPETAQRARRALRILLASR